MQRVIVGVFMRAGWPTQAYPLPGIVLGGVAHVQGRVLLRRVKVEKPSLRSGKLHLLRANLAPFFTVEVPNALVRVQLGDKSQDVVADREGYFTAQLSAKGLSAGQHTVTATPIEPPGQPAQATLDVAGADVDFVVVSDIDDTIVDSGVAQGAITTLRTVFLSDSSTRVPLVGAPALYRALANTGEGKPNRPFVYLSTSPWNLADFLQRFLQRNQFPRGSIVLTDLGPGLHGRFRISGREHKLNELRKLADGEPNQRFILLGDSGQADPEIYATFAAEHAGRVTVVYIRNAGEPTPKRLSRLAASAEVLREVGVPLVVADDSDTFMRHAIDTGLIQK